MSGLPPQPLEFSKTRPRGAALRVAGTTLLAVFVVAWPIAILTWTFDWFGAKTRWLARNEVALAPVVVEASPSSRYPFTEVRIDAKQLESVPAGATTQQARQPQSTGSDEAYERLVENCRYWTQEVRSGAQMTSNQNLACDRMRQYAATHNLEQLQVPNYRAQPATTTTTNRRNDASDAKQTQQVTTCRYVDQKIDNIESRLRAGYRVREGERLKESLRQYKKQRRDQCRDVQR